MDTEEAMTKYADKLKRGIQQFRDSQPPESVELRFLRVRQDRVVSSKHGRDTLPEAEWLLAGKPSLRDRNKIVWRYCERETASEKV